MSQKICHVMFQKTFWKRRGAEVEPWACSQSRVLSLWVPGWWRENLFPFSSSQTFWLGSSQGVLTQGGSRWKHGSKELMSWRWHQSGVPAQHNLWNGLKNVCIFLLQLFHSLLLWAPFSAIQTEVPGIRLNPLAANILILLQLIVHSWTKRWSSAMSVVQWNSDFGTLKKAADVL